MSIKVLLNQDVPTLGEIGDLVDVKPGYARNYLLPQGVACVPTPENIRRVEEERKKVEAERIKRRQELEKVAEKLEGCEITLTRMANEVGNLYGSVSGRDIAEALAAEGFTVEASEILIHEPIRQLDAYELEVRLATDLTATIKLWVVPEKGTVLSEDVKAALEGKGVEAGHVEAVPSGEPGDQFTEEGVEPTRPIEDDESTEAPSEAEPPREV